MRQAIVVGAGIGGLAVAHGLKRDGWDVTVLERAPELAAVGAGLTLWPNALTALDALDLGGRVRSIAQPVESVATFSPDGRVMARFPLSELTARFGSLLAVHRSELQRTLIETLGANPIRTGAAVCGVEVGVRAAVTLAGGEKREADLVLVANGVRSALRESVTGFPVASRRTGVSAWRGVAPFGLADEHAGSETWGRGARFGIVPLPGERTYWFAVAPLSPTPQLPLALRERLAGWHAPIGELLAATAPSSVIGATPLEDLPPLPSWTRGRIALLGDAAHATTPNLGQGAAQALEDAAALVRALDAMPGDVPEALRRYEAARKPRAELVVRRSRAVGRFADVDGRLAARLRDLVMRITPPSVTVRQLAPLLTPARKG